MKRRSKQNSTYWNNRLDKLLETAPEMRLTKNRYKCLSIMLQKQYEPIIKSVSPDTMQMFLKDVCYLDRELRIKTQGEEKELKKILSQEKVIELGYI